MTCCIGVAQNGVVTVGADSAGVAEYSLTIRADTKVFRNGPMIFSFTHSFRMGQLLRHAFTVPDHDPRTDVDKWMATVFIDAVRKCLKDGGYASRNSETESGGTFLVGYKGTLYQVESDYQVGIPADAPVTGHQFAAVGCGQDIAHGAMFVQDVTKPAKERILAALTAAERYSAAVRGPFVVEELTP